LIVIKNQVLKMNNKNGFHLSFNSSHNETQLPTTSRSLWFLSDVTVVKS